MPSPNANTCSTDPVSSGQSNPVGVFQCDKMAHPSPCCAALRCGSTHLQGDAHHHHRDGRSPAAAAAAALLALAQRAPPQQGQGSTASSGHAGAAAAAADGHGHHHHASIQRGGAAAGRRRPRRRPPAGQHRTHLYVVLYVGALALALTAISRRPWALGVIYGTHGVLHGPHESMGDADAQSTVPLCESRPSAPSSRSSSAGDVVHRIKAQRGPVAEARLDMEEEKYLHDLSGYSAIDPRVRSPVSQPAPLNGADVGVLPLHPNTVGPAAFEAALPAAGEGAAVGGAPDRPATTDAAFIPAAQPPAKQPASSSPLLLLRSWWACRGDSVTGGWIRAADTGCWQSCVADCSAHGELFSAHGPAPASLAFVALRLPTPAPGSCPGPTTLRAGTGAWQLDAQGASSAVAICYTGRPASGVQAHADAGLLKAVLEGIIKPPQHMLMQADGTTGTPVPPSSSSSIGSAGADAVQALFGAQAQAAWGTRFEPAEVDGKTSLWGSAKAAANGARSAFGRLRRRLRQGSRHTAAGGGTSVDPPDEGARGANYDPPDAISFSGEDAGNSLTARLRSSGSVKSMGGLGARTRSQKVMPKPASSEDGRIGRAPLPSTLYVPIPLGSDSSVLEVVQTQVGGKEIPQRPLL